MISLNAQELMVTRGGFDWLESQEGVVFTEDLFLSFGREPYFCLPVGTPYAAYVDEW